MTGLALDPDPDELAAIEADAVVLAAELLVVDAECRLALRPDEAAHRALRRAVTALTRLYAQQHGTQPPPLLCLQLDHGDPQ